MEKVLRTLKYSIDDESTLTLVTGGGQPEKVSIDIADAFSIDNVKSTVDYAYDVPLIAARFSHHTRSKVSRAAQIRTQSNR